MKVYVVYGGGDYACALAITTNYQAAEQYQNELLNYNDCHTWIDTIEIGEQITEFETG